MLFLAYSFLLLAFLLFMMNVTDRFLKYVGYGTQSDPNAGLNPSTPGQMEFAHVLKEEMEAIGIQEVELDEYGYVMGVIPSTVERETPAIGFIAHMDTSPEMSGRHVNPRIIENYAGNDIVLNKEKGIVLSTEEFPELMNYVGQTLITTDGNTLLGADDKAGIAEILTAAEYLIGHPEVKHGKICICFTPDEEIGEGPDHFNVKKFGAKFAYTMDGGEIGELEFENFNAANARIVFKGRNIHPGYAKNKMVNSIAVANEFMASLPKKEVPENTSGYEGFFHVYSIKGDVETTEIEILIRDFDRERFEWRKNTIEPWKARPGMHASLCHNPDQGHLEPLISVQRNPTKPAGSGARPKAQPPPDWVQHQFTTNLIWFFTVAAYQYKLKYHHLHTAHDHLQN